MVVIIKFTPACYYDVLSIHSLLPNNKSSSISQFVNGKSRNLQKLLRCLSGIVTSTFKVGTVGCPGRFTSPGFPGRDGLSGVFPTIFVLYLNDLPSEEFLSAS